MILRRICFSNKSVIFFFAIPWQARGALGRGGSVAQKPSRRRTQPKMRTIHLKIARNEVRKRGATAAVCPDTQSTTGVLGEWLRCARKACERPEALNTSATTEGFLGRETARKSREHFGSRSWGPIPLPQQRVFLCHGEACLWHTSIEMLCLRTERSAMRYRAGATLRTTPCGDATSRVRDEVACPGSQSCFVSSPVLQKA